MQSITDLQLSDKRVLIRVDLNVPIQNGEITDDTRIQASLPTLKHALEQSAGLILVSHLGRPKPNQDNSHLTLQPVASHLANLLKMPVRLVGDWEQEGVSVNNGEVVLLENIRFCEGETKNDPDLSERLGSLCDVYVNDAFGTAHRAHASTQGITQYVETCAAGLLLDSEINALERCLSNPKRPLVVVLGGAKVSGKLETLLHLKNIADTILIGGGIANTFLLADGFEVGESLVEHELIEVSQTIQQTADLPLPVDVMTTHSIKNDSIATLRLPDQISSSEMIVDIGPETARRWAQSIAEAGTVVWNGPMGVDEFVQFGEGTRTVAEACANTNAFTIAGGGDTIAAISRHGVADDIDYISTGGGAFLEYIEGKQLPGVVALQ